MVRVAGGDRDFVSVFVVFPSRVVGVMIRAGRDYAVGVDDVDTLTEQFDNLLRDGFERLVWHRTYWCITILPVVKQVFSLFLLSYPRPQHTAQMVVVIQGGD